MAAIRQIPAVGRLFSIQNHLNGFPRRPDRQTQTKAIGFRRSRMPDPNLWHGLGRPSAYGPTTIFPDIPQGRGPSACGGAAMALQGDRIRCRSNQGVVSGENGRHDRDAHRAARAQNHAGPANRHRDEDHVIRQRPPNSDPQGPTCGGRCGISEAPRGQPDRKTKPTCIPRCCTKTRCPNRRQILLCRNTRSRQRK